MGEKILIALEELLILKGLKFSLEQDGYNADAVENMDEAKTLAENNKYDLIIMDESIGNISSNDFYQRVREKYNTPFIVLTSNADMVDKNQGIYDYVLKPINIVDFKSKVNAALVKSRGESNQQTGVIKLWDITIDLSSRNIVAGNREIDLTSKEYSILVFLASNKNKVYSREELLDEIWGNEHTGDKRIVDVHIRRLREKIENDPSNPSYIITKWGSGYYFNG
ncbi:transcriptional regulatory protein YycF [Oxobacter pfennigii]|uniref:Stage 0 sporulation protein A homolog n=1 Tax=Oxobacter pfennigii TaxID=36849 RepID=A0A0N8NSU2_9CLOT|nr:response regulator transcription factor [Oxobacter pfennigii]KPU42984.1 transcriptional regulatory protein YycF [Oxobacter pfennigii]